jgi:hypothetical protein
MSFDDLPAERQTETHAAGFCCLERLKQMFGDLGRDTSAIIVDFDGNGSTVMTTAYANGSIGHIGGRIDSIAQEIDQDLPDLRGIYQHDWQRPGLDLDAHRSPLGFILETRRYGFGELEEIDGQSLCLIGHQEFTQSRQHVTGALYLGLSLFHGFGEELMVDVIIFEKVAASVNIGRES